jgi:hypothetical protein
MWDEKELKDTNARRLMVLGTKTAGMVVRVTRLGIEINGYYSGFKSSKKHANMRKFASISWEDIDKAKKAIFKKKKRKKTGPETPDEVVDKVDKKYLEKLPQVTLNGALYYIDFDRQCRMPVSNPTNIFKFKEAIGHDSKDT